MLSILLPIGEKIRLVKNDNLNVYDSVACETWSLVKIINLFNNHFPPPAICSKQEVNLEQNTIILESALSGSFPTPINLIILRLSFGLCLGLELCLDRAPALLPNIMSDYIPLDVVIVSFGLKYFLPSQL